MHLFLAGKNIKLLQNSEHKAPTKELALQKWQKRLQRKYIVPLLCCISFRGRKVGRAQEKLADSLPVGELCLDCGSIWAPLLRSERVFAPCCFSSSPARQMCGSE